MQESWRIPGLLATKNLSADLPITDPKHVVVTGPFEPSSASILVYTRPPAKLRPHEFSTTSKSHAGCRQATRHCIMSSISVGSYQSSYRKIIKIFHTLQRNDEGHYTTIFLRFECKTIAMEQAQMTSLFRHNM